MMFSTTGALVVVEENPNIKNTVFWRNWGVTPPPLMEDHSAPKNSVGLGVTPPPQRKIRLLVFDDIPLEGEKTNILRSG